MSSPVVSGVVPVVSTVNDLAKGKGKGRGRKPKADPPVEDKVVVDPDLTDDKPVVKGKGRGRKPKADPPTDHPDLANPPNQANPRKNLIAKHALLHSFSFFLAKRALDANVFDLPTFHNFLRSSNFFDDIPSLHSFFLDLDLKLILKDAKNARVTQKKELAGKGKKQTKAKKGDASGDKPTDLISSLVNLANGKEPIVPPSSPTTSNKATDGEEAAPGAPVKQKRKYNRKPKSVPIAEELSQGDE